MNDTPRRLRAFDAMLAALQSLDDVCLDNREQIDAAIEMARDAATLYNYRTGAPLRAATANELARSIDAAEHDGGAGVILVEIDGIEVPCYAMAT